MTSFAIRRYEREDLEDCLGVFDCNVPKFFRAEERDEYATFLEDLPGPYLMLLDTSGRIVGCGGYAIVEGSDVADLCWGMVRQDRHGKGAGRALTESRIERIHEHESVAAVALRTSQHTSAFYERLGFIITEVVPDGYAPGLHRVDMRLELPR